MCISWHVYIYMKLTKGQVGEYRRAQPQRQRVWGADAPDDRRRDERGDRHAERVGHEDEADPSGRNASAVGYL